MNKRLLKILAFLIFIAFVGCNFDELDEAFDKAKDRAMYGNWCGPGLSGGVNGTDPAIDSLDELCRSHDKCYENANPAIPYSDYAACTPNAAEKLACDKTFVNGMKALTADSTTWTLEPPADKKAEAELYLTDALKIFGPCVDLYGTP